MTEVPPANGGPEGDAEPYVPSGVRRSTYTPPGSDADTPDFDDDALAAAMAAEVAAYTSPMPIMPPPAAPILPPAEIDEPVETEVGEPEPVEAPSIPTRALETSVSPTLEAIERLESELRRRAEEFGPPTAEPEPTLAGPTAAEPIEPPAWDPPAFAAPMPPPLVEPPAPMTGPVPIPTRVPPPEPPVFDLPPVTPPIDLPPPASRDFAHLPPPVGLQPAAIPPYDPTADLAVPPPHPDDLGPGDLGAGDLGPSESIPPPDDGDVDEVDRAFGTGAIAVDSMGSGNIIAPPSEPIPTVRLADDEPALVDEQLESHPALVVESAGPEATALDLRAGRAARLFWLWFAANSSVVSLSLGAVLFGLGMSLRQALVAILIGVALSFLPLGLVTLAGKWSGQPTMIVSRATFGIVGNGLPAILAIISRVFWGGALLWILATGVARVLVDAGLDVGLGEQVWTLVGLGAGFALAFVVAIFGYGFIARVQLVLSILTAVLVAGVVVLTFPRLDLAAAQSIDDGPWTLLVTGVVLVFSFVGLAWVHSSADVARYQRTDSDGGSTMLWATFGATLPAFILIAWGALLAASDPLIADGLSTNPLYTIAALLPLWYPAPLIAALGLGLLSGAVLTIYSGGFALQSLGIGARRSVTTAIAGVLVLAAAAALLFLAGDARGLIRDLATTVAVPVAAWAGILGAEIMIRRRGFNTGSLLRRGGIYPAVRRGNLVGLVVISALGFGLTSAVLPGLDWQGYLFPFIGLAGDDPLLTSDLGVLAALVLGILLPLATAVPAIRRQERALVD